MIDNKLPLELNDAQIAEVLAGFGIQASSDHLFKIREYISILLKWNRSINLTSITSPVEIVARHFGESMFASRLLAMENCRLADVGSGAGFPGLALKIICPNLRMVLIESNRKKSAFLSEVVRSLGFADVELITSRFEEMRPEAGSFEIVAARALGGFPQLLRWAKQVLTARGHLLLWTGGEDTIRIMKTPGWIWSPAIRIPESQRRFIVTGRPSP